MSNYLKVFNNLCSLLQRQKDNSAAEQAIESTRRRIKSVYEAAIQDGTYPRKPDFDDEVFRGIKWDEVGSESDEDDDTSLDDEEVPSISVRPAEGSSLNHEVLELPPVSSLSEAQQRLAKYGAQLTAMKRRVNRLGVVYQTERKRVKRMLKAEQTGRKYRNYHVVRAPRAQPAPCWCGCGGMVQPNQYNKTKRFLKGHNRKYLKWIMLVERAGCKISDLPPLLRKNLKWTKCKECGRPIPTTDPQGRPIEENIGLACYRRVKRIWWPYRHMSYN